MSQQIAFSRAGNFEVSTIQTMAGGAPENARGISPFSESDYIDETPWPYETMVFRGGSSTGLHHRAYASIEDARRGHAVIVAALDNGTLEMPFGVHGPSGVPSLTAAEWAASIVSEPAVSREE